MESICSFKPLKRTRGGVTVVIGLVQPQIYLYIVCIMLYAYITHIL